MAKKLKKQPGTALVSMKDLESLYAVDAKASLDTEPMAGIPIIRTKGGKFRFDEQELKKPLKVVVVGSSMVNAYYDSEYDPDSPVPPACYAIGEVGKESEMAPKNVPKPQNATCTGCPQNAFGTAAKGRGKACRNQRRIAMFMLDDKRPEPQLGVMVLPPSAIRAFSAYTKQVAAVLNRPLHGVVTSLDFDDSEMPVPQATLEGKIDDMALAQRAIKARDRAIKELLFAQIDTSSYGQKPKAKANGKKKPKGKRKY